MPRTAILYIAERCNQHCVFCLEVDKTWKPLPDFSTRQVAETLQSLRAGGAEQITFMGGETLFRRDIGDILAEARRLGYRRIGVTTNGTVLGKPGFLRRLMADGLDFIELSLHGHTAALANAIGGTRFTFRRQALALAELDAIGTLLTIVNVVICRENKDHVVDIARYLTGSFPRIPARFKLKFVGLMGLAESQTTQPRLRYAEVDAVAAGDFLAERGVPFAYNNIPLCRLGRHAAHSLELGDMAADEQYLDYDHQGGSDYVDTRYHLAGRCWPGPCGACTLRPICSGIENAYRLQHGHDELAARDDDPLPILSQALAGFGLDPAQAGRRLEALRDEPRPAVVSRDPTGAVASASATTVRLRRSGAHGPVVELRLEPSQAGRPAYATVGHLGLSYRAEGDALFREAGVADLLRLAEATLAHGEAAADADAAAAAITAAAAGAGWDLLPAADTPAPAPAAMGGAASRSGVGQERRSLC